MSQQRRTQASGEFSRFAHTYGKYNMVQTQVAKALVTMLPKVHYANIIDVGCGDGGICKALANQGVSFDALFALDSASEMLALHPSSPQITKQQKDFNREDFLSETPNPSLLIASSSLQWASNLQQTLSTIASKSQECYFAIFTANTFKSMQSFTKLNSPIYATDVLQEHIDKHFHTNYTLKQYELTFENNKALFDYIKKSGVSGGTKRLSYKEAKKLISEYKLGYLEFEVLFVKATSKEIA